jgi:hypothetical protein
MPTRTAKLITLLAFIGVASIGTARADCEADMDKLDQAMKGSAFTPKAKAILEDARKKAVEAVKKDDDTTCNKVITDAFTRAGVQQ